MVARDYEALKPAYRAPATCAKTVGMLAQLRRTMDENIEGAPMAIKAP